MAAKAQGNEVDATITGEVASPNAFRSFLVKMAQIATLEDTMETYMGDDILPILEAENEAEMWDADERPQYNAKYLSGCELEILGFEVKFSAGDNEEIQTVFVDPSTHKKMYLLIRSVRLNNAGEKQLIRLPDVGEVFSWNTSARNIVPKLFWMLEHGMFDSGAAPVRCKIQGTDLGSGKSVEKLKPLAGITVNATSEPPF
jgi:hypothetical protein